VTRQLGSRPRYVMAVKRVVVYSFARARNSACSWLRVWSCVQKGVRRMRAAAGQDLYPVQSSAAVATVTRVVSRPAALSPKQSPTRVVDREVSERRLRAEYGARENPTRRPRTSRIIPPEITLFLVIFAFIVGTSCFVAARILNPNTHPSPIWVAPYSASNVSPCSVRAWPDGWRSDACARPLPSMGLGSHSCC
jgi:hypothetical protein